MKSSNTIVCSQNCQFPCQSCQYNNPSVCIACYFGYTLELSQGSMSCLPAVQNCTSTSGCYACPYGQVISDGECVSCGASCARCEPSAPNNCTSCYSGYYVTAEMTCALCPDNCTTCTGETNCVTCAPGYVTFVQKVATTRTYCIACSPPCNTCTLNPDTCTSCITGFEFTGWSCVSTFYYNFIMTFKVGAQDFYTNYMLYLNTTAAAMQTKNFKVMSIQSIQFVEDTTKIYTKISTLKSSTSDNEILEYNNLEFALTGRGYFANMPIINQTLSPSE